MPLNTDLDVAPYFDDFDETKNYHRVLFRPSVAVQARELTQLQTILQNQIERFGNWSFRNGDIVAGCTIYDMPSVPYIRLADFASNGSANTSSLDVQDYVNAIATSVTSGLKAKVLYANAGFTTNYPETNILYLKYINTGTNGEKQFSNAELLTFDVVSASGNTPLSNVYTYANTNSTTIASGNSHGISVSEGVIFINGNFVRVPNSTFGLVNTYGVYAGNNVVGFKLSERIITENQDSSLLDNALGYTNENAPGAHRLQLIPYIVSLDPVTAANTVDFNPIATYNFGSFVTKTVASSNVYSILGDAIAKRTHEESGDYVVNPFVVDTITTIANDSVVVPSNANSVLARVSPGVGYSQGKRVGLLKTSYINIRRGTDTVSKTQQQISFNYGSYFVIKEVSGTFDFDQAQSVTLYDTPQKSITNRTYAKLTPTGTAIGTALVRCFTYNTGSPGTATAQYILHVFNIKLNTGYISDQVKSIYYSGSNKAVADIDVPGLKGVQSKAQLYTYGVAGIKNLRDQYNNLATEYVYRKKTSGTMLTGGNVTITITSSAPGGSDILNYGIGVLSDSNAGNFTLVATANVDSVALTGTVTVNTTSNSVIGSSTTFDTTFAAGDLIKVGTVIRTVSSVGNSTYMTVDNPFASPSTGATYYKSYVAGKIIPISQNFSGKTSFIEVTNSTSFTISSAQNPSSSLPVDVTYNVLRTSAVPASKVIKKNRFVKIDTSSNPKGPWCLGFSDVHKISKIYGTSNGTYTTSGIDLTTSFSYSTGQRDTHYDYAYLYPNKKYNANSYPNLLVQLDYFTTNTASGIGFFNIESYPIDDANTANTNAIQTKDLPYYTTDSGDRINLRDCIDFRTPATSTAADTGNVDLANSASITTAVASASLNPSSTLSLNVSAYGLNFPCYGQNFESNFTRYLGRKDLVMITPDNVLKVKEGVPSDAPQTPLFPENAMPMAVLNVPPYPSLTTDQADSLLSVNQLSSSLIRDTTLAISALVVTNRRYTMKDIGTLDQRISNLEYYTQLSLLEKKAKDMTVTDGNGLDRFKNGIFVDPFSDFALSDVSNPEFSIAIDSERGVARPKIIREVINIKFNNSSPSSNVVKTGRLVTLSYTELPFIIQANATKYRSASLVSFAWNGKAFLVPSYDNHNDLNNTGSINITINNATPWQEFAASPFASNFGEWRTTTSITSNTVVTGKANIQTINLGSVRGYGAQYGQGTTGYKNAVVAWAQQTAAKLGYNPNMIVGNLTVNQTWMTAALGNSYQGVKASNATYYY